MKTFKEIENPFIVHTPEGMKAEDAIALFVDVFSDFPKILNVGHLFLHGPRGSGKSMIFRYLEPDCQCLAKQINTAELTFFSVLIPVKRTNFNRTELHLLAGQHASILINEHFMTLNIAEKFFDSFSNIILEDNSSVSTNAIVQFMKDDFYSLLQNCGYADTLPDNFQRSAKDCVETMKGICKQLISNILGYSGRLAFARGQSISYSGPICNYIDFLYPLMCKAKERSIIPKKPIYLLIDDADLLSLTQTQILNTWVSSRTSTEVSIKVSTQLRYKTYQTITGQNIETPHDFAEVNISTIYTASPKSKYKERMTEIVRRRLVKIAGLEMTPEVFFPEDKKQEAAIKKIAQEYVDKWATKGKGYRAGDDAYRYARPEYIKRLGGSRKSKHTYKYAGFDQLLHISSGIIRYFLDSAAFMFGEMQASRQNEAAECIPPDVQSKIIFAQAVEFLMNQFEKIKDDRSAEAPQISEIRKLENLINALGELFHKILVSDRSERRVFSIAISDALDNDMRELLKLGTEFGYFHKSSIGNKEGTGRTALYVLSRRLAPYFKLDPTSFAGYLFVTNDDLITATINPKKFIRDRLKDTDNKIKQFTLF